MSYETTSADPFGDLRGMNADELQAESTRLGEVIASWSDRDGNQKDYNALVARASEVNSRVAWHLDVARRYARGTGLESAYQTERRDAGLRARAGWVSALDADPHMQTYRSAALSTLERHCRADVMTAAAADRADRVLREGDPLGHTARYLAAVGNDHYRSAFTKLLRDPLQGHLRFGPEEVEAFREVNWATQAAEMRAVMTTAVTGFPLPLTVDPSIILTGNGALNPIRQISSVITIGTHNWQGVSSDGVVASYVQEGTEATDATPTLVGPNIATQQGRAFCQFTIEAGQDDPTLQEQLVQLIADARDVLDASKFLSGTGTNEPSGILNIGSLNGLTTTQRVLTATTAAFAVGDPWLLKAALPARFIPSTTFAANPSTFDTAYRFVGGNSTEPFQFGNGDRGGDFLGRPKVEWSTMVTGTTSGNRLIVGGDFRTGYKIVDRIGMSAELIPHMMGASRLPLGVRGLYVYWRTGAGVVAVNAFRYLEVK
jgi:HK97 family phage major capsid protein